MALRTRADRTWTGALRALLALCGLSIAGGIALADTIQNSATGSTNGVGLGLANAAISLNRVGTTGTVTITDPSIPGDTLTITVADADLDTNSGLAESVVVTAVNTVTGESEAVTLTETGLNTGVFTGTVATTYGASADADDNGTFNTKALDIVRVTYNDALLADGSSGSVTDDSNVQGGATGTVTITDPSIPGDTLTITVADADLDTNPGLAESVVVTAVNTVTGESEAVTLTETGLNTGVFTGTVATTYGASADADDNGTFNTKALDIVRVTYNDALRGDGSSGSVTDDSNVQGGNTATVTITDPSIPGDTLTLTVADADLDTNPGLAETLIVTSVNTVTGESEAVTLTETGLNTGVFTGTVATTYGASADADDNGTFNTKALDIVRVTYNDALLADGSSGSVTDDSNVQGGTTGTVTITDPSIPGDTLTITVTDVDLDTNPGLAETLIVTSVNTVTGESEAVTLTETGLNTGVFTGTVATTYGASADADDNGTFNTKALDIVRVTYNDALRGDGSSGSVTDDSNVQGGTTGTVTITDPSVPGDTLTLTVADVDLDANSGLAETLIVTSVNTVTGESEAVTLTETGLNTGVFIGTVATTYGASADADDNGTFNTKALDIVRVTYNDALRGDGSSGSVTDDSNVQGGNTGTVTITDPSVPGDTLTLTVADVDLDANPGLAETLIVTSVNTVTGESEAVTLTETGLNTGVFIGTVATTYGASADADDNGTFNTKALDIVRVTYNDALRGDGSSGSVTDDSNVQGGNTGTVTITDPSVPGDTLTLTVADVDLDANPGLAETLIVTSVNTVTGESEAVTLTETGLNTGVFIGTVATTYGASADADDNGTFNTKAFDIVRVTYNDALRGDGSSGSVTDDSNVQGGNTGTVTITDPSIPGDTLTITVADADLDTNPGLAETLIVTSVNTVTGESEAVTLTETGLNTGVFIGTVATTYGAAADADDNGTFNTKAFDIVRVTYNDALRGDGSSGSVTDDSNVQGGTTGTVTITDPSVPGDTLTLTVADVDLDANPGLAETLIVTSVNTVTGESEAVTLTETGLNTGVFIGTVATTYGASADADDNGTFNTKALDIVRVTYNDALRADGSSGSATDDSNVQGGVTGTVTITDPSIPGDTLTITVTDADLDTNPGLAETLIVTSVNTVTGESEAVTLTETGLNTGVFTGTVATTYGAAADADDNGTFNTKALDIVRVTYNDALLADGSSGSVTDDSNVQGGTTGTVTITDPSIPGDTLTITVTDADLDTSPGLAETLIVTSVNTVTGESEAVTLTETGLNTGVFTGTVATTYGASADADDNGTFNTKALDIVRVTYNDALLADGSSGSVTDDSNVQGGTTGTVTITDPSIPGDTLTITVADADLDTSPGLAETLIVTSVNTVTGESEAVTLTETGLNTGVFTGTVATTYGASADADDNGTFNTKALDIVRVTYNDALLADGSSGSVTDDSNVQGGATGTVTITDPSIPGDTLTITVTDADLDTNPGLAETLIVTSVNTVTGESEAVTLTETGLNTGVFTGIVATTYGAAADADDNGTFNTKALDIVRVTYNDALLADGSSGSVTDDSNVQGGATGTVTITDPSIPGDTLTITVADADLDTNPGLAETLIVTSVNTVTGESEAVTLTETGLNTGVFIGTVATTYGASADADDNGTFNTKAFDIVRVTYNDALRGDGSSGSVTDDSNVQGGTTGTVTITDPSVPGDTLTLTVADVDLDANPGLAETLIVTSVNTVTGESEAVTLTETGLNTGVFIGTVATTYGASADADDNGTFNTKAFDIVRVTYNDALRGDGSSGSVTDDSNVQGGNTGTVTITDPSVPGDTLTITVTDADLDTNPGLAETLIVTSVNTVTGESEAVTLTETGLNTGVFTGTVATTYGASADADDNGTFNTKALDIVRVTYNDALRADGSSGSATDDSNVQGGVTGTVTITDPSIPGDTLTITVTDADLDTNPGLAETLIVTSVNTVTGESEAVTLTETGLNTGVFIGTVATTYGASADADDNGTFNTKAFDIVRVTYNDALRGDGSSGSVTDDSNVQGGNTGTVTITDPSIPGDTLTITVADADLDTNPGLAETLIVTSVNTVTGESEAVTLTETGLNTGVFIGTVATTYGAAADADDNGTFNTKAFDIVRVTYNDALRGDGSSGSVTDDSNVQGGTTGTVTITDPSVPGDTLTLTVADVDLDANPGLAETLIVTSVNTVTGESEAVTLTETGLNTGVFIGTVATTYGASADADDNGTFNTKALDIVRVTYNDALRADGSSGSATDDSNVQGGVTGTVTITDPSIPGDTLTITVADADLDTNPGLAETLIVTSVNTVTGESEAVTLTETGLNTGVFIGTVATTYGAAADADDNGTFNTKALDIVRVTYNDALLADGSSGSVTDDSNVQGGTTGTVTITDPSIPGDTLTITVTDADLDTSPGLAETLIVTSVNTVTGESEAVTLTETGLNTGVFTGTVATTYGASADADDNGTFNTKALDIVRVTYNDALLADGSSGSVTDDSNVQGGNTGTVTITDPSIPGDTLTITVADADLDTNPGLAETLIVTSVNTVTGESEAVTLTETGLNTGVFIGTVATTYGAAADADDNGTFNTKAFDIVRVTYNDALRGDGSSGSVTDDSNVQGGTTGTVTITDPSVPGDTLTLTVADVDLDANPGLAETLIVTSVNTVTGESEAVTLTETGLNTGVFIGTVATTYGASADADDNGTFNTKALDIVRVTYNDALRADGSSGSATDDSNVQGGVTGTVTITDPSIPGDTLTITVTDADLDTNPGLAETLIVTSVNTVTGESEAVTLTETGLNTGVFTGTVATTYGAAADADDNGTFNTKALDIVRVTYNDALLADGSSGSVTDDSNVQGGTTGTVTITDPSIPGDTLTITVTDADLDTSPGLAETLIVTSVNTVTGESEAVTLTETGLNTGVFTGTVATTYGASADADDNGTFNTKALDIVRVTYNDALLADGSSGSVTDDSNVQGGTTGTVTITDPSIPGDTLTITVADADLDTSPGLAETLIVTSVNTVTGESEAVTLTETGLNTGVFTGTVATTYGASADADDNGTFNTKALDIVRVTYNDALLADGSSGSVTDDSNVQGGATGTVTITDPSIPGDTLTITVTDADLDTNPGLAETLIVTSVNTVTGESEAVTLTETGLNTGVFTGIVATTYGAAADADDNGTFNTKALDIVRVTYNDALLADGSSGSVTDDSNVQGGATGTVTITDPSIPGDTLTITVADADLDTNPGLAETLIVTSVNTVTGESEAVTLTETGLNTGVFTGTVATTYGASADADDNGTFNTKALDIVRVTYNDALLADGSSGSDTDDSNVQGGTTGTVTITDPSIPGDTLTITVTDVDLDTNPGLAETLIVTSVNTVTGESEAVTLTETGLNTGVFTGTVATTYGASADADDNGTFNTKALDIVRVTYNDALLADGSSGSVTDDSNVQGGATGTVTITDPSIPGDTLTITVTDADLDTSPGLAETLIVTSVNTVTGESEAVTLTETGLNTGVFTGTVATTYGASADADDNGTFNTKALDIVRVTYNDALLADGSSGSVTDDSNVQGGATGTVTITDPSIPGDTLTITVTDADLDTNPGLAETLIVTSVNTVTGESEAVTLTETGLNTGVFTGIVATTYGAAADADDNGTFNTKALDIVRVTYNDALLADGSSGSDTDDSNVQGGTTGTVTITDPSIPGDTLTITVTDADLDTNPGLAETLIVTSVNTVTGESEAVTLTETGLNTGVFTGTVATTYGAAADADDNGTFNTKALDIVRVTYDDALLADGSSGSVTDDSNVQGGTTGTVTITDPSIPGDTLTITVTDADLDTNPGLAETLIVTSVNTVTGESEAVTLTETGLNTGVFTGTVATTYGAAADADDNGTFNTKALDIVRVTYDDAARADGGSGSVTDDSNVQGGVTGSVSITDPSAPGTTLTITVTDADLDVDPGVAESVVITVVNTTNGESETLSLTETGPNTGVFVGTLGTTLDNTAGTDDDGTLNVQAGDLVRATYDDALRADGSSGAVSADSDVAGGTDGTITVTPTSRPGDPVTISVEDADVNADPAVVETVPVTLVNDATGESESVVLTETGPSTGVFTGSVATTFGTLAGTNDDGTFNTSAGDTLTATYVDLLTSIPGGSSTPLTDIDAVVGGASGTVSITPTSVPGDLLIIDVVDADLNADPATVETVVVTVINDATGESESLTLTETGPSSGTFAGTLATTPAPGPGPDDDGVLVTNSGDTLSAIYGDAFSASGGPAIATDTGVVVGASIRLTKIADRPEASVGDVVAFTLIVENTAGAAVSGLEISDRIPAGFKLVADSARLVRAGADGQLGGVDDVVTALPATGARPVVFGPIALVADETVHVRYVLRVGSGVHHGRHVNEAVPLTGGTSAGNLATASVDIVADPTFDLSVIIGKVFEDQDRDGWQDPGEAGVAQAMVALDDGTYALTDAYGRYHFPAARPGQRMLKINLHSLPPGTEAVLGPSRIVRVTPGLLAQANFGVVLRHDSESIGTEATPGVSVASDSSTRPVEIRGNAEALSLLVNGHAIALPDDTARMVWSTLDETVHITGSELSEPVRFQLDVARAPDVADWALRIGDDTNETVQTIAGHGPPPPSTTWNGRVADGELIEAGEIYQYSLGVSYLDGSAFVSAPRLFGVNRDGVISLDLTGDAFESGKATLSSKATEILREAAQVLRQHPNERVVVEGHTDDVGSEEYNLELSRRRAEAATKFLVERMRLPAAQFAIRAHGEQRPIAPNLLEDGRALNRRVEINGEISDVAHVAILDRLRQEPRVRINGTRVDVGGDGRFATTVEPGTDSRVEVEMAGGDGRSVRSSVRLPEIEVASPVGRLLVPLGGSAGGCSVDGASGDRPAVSCRIEGRTQPGNSVEIDGRAVVPQADGSFATEVALGIGVNQIGLASRDDDGLARVAHMRIEVSDRDDQGRLLLVSDGVPNLTVDLPPRGVRLPSPALALSGHTDPGNRVVANGRTLVVDADGHFRGTLELPPGPGRLIVQATSPSGSTGQIEREIDVARNQLFLLAFADGEFGRLSGDGLVEAAGVAGGDNYYSEGRVAFYLKGTIAGKYLITSALDTGRAEFDELFDDFGGEASSRLLTNLDPDKFYPIYGDDSTVVYDTETQGKFYLALESESIDALVGNYSMSLDDTELSAYRRTLSGGRFAYRSLSETAHGAPDTEAVVFVSDVQQEHVHDELRATGGSLYYLSQRDVIEGSEEVTLVVRDKDTGLVLNRQPQQQNFDYTIKYEEGRVMFHRPISSVTGAGSIVNANFLAGHDVYLYADYETIVRGFEKTGWGARVRQQIGDRVAVGGTRIEDERDAGSYELSGVDAEVRLGGNSRLIAEYADSAGEDAATYVSLDGGLTYARSGGAGGSDGSAWKAAAELDLGEWFGRPERYKLSLYRKELEPGFFASGNTQERGTEKTGMNVDLQLGEADSVRLRHALEEREALGGATDETKLSSLQWNHRADRWGLTVELADRDTDIALAATSTRSRLGASRFWAKLSQKVTASLEHQATFSGVDNDQTTLGLEYQAWPTLAFTIKGTDGSAGRSAQGGAILTLPQANIYLTERLDEAQGGRRSSTIVGARSALGPSSKVYSEYQWETSEAGEDKTVSLVGLERQWDAGPGLRVLVTGEVADVDDPTTTAGISRSSVSAGVSYAAGETFKATTRQELRYERGGTDRVQYFTVNQLDYRLNPDFNVLARYRYSTTENRDTNTDESRLEERSLGLALRPTAHDRINSLFKYSRLADERPDALGTGERAGRTMDVVSLETALRINRRVEWFGKAATRFHKDRIADLAVVESTSLLAIQRFNVKIWRPLDIGLEYRVLSQRESDDRRQGWLTEATWEVLRHFRVGLGYNFTDFSDDELSQNDYSVDGWFIRVQGRY